MQPDYSGVILRCDLHCFQSPEVPSLNTFGRVKHQTGNRFAVAAVTVVDADSKVHHGPPCRPSEDQGVPVESPDPDSVLLPGAM